VADQLGALYHWSPTTRRDRITTEGLRPGQPPTQGECPLHAVCLAPTPALAWVLSEPGDRLRIGAGFVWDLWMVRLQPTDDVEITTMRGPRIEEVRVRNPIPPDRLWYVGTRDEFNSPHTRPAGRTAPPPQPSGGV
jgi:hypothetical protein